MAVQLSDTFTLHRKWFAPHMALTALAALLGLPAPVGCLPFAHLASRMVRSEPNSPAGAADTQLTVMVQVAVLSICWSTVSLLAAWLLLMPLGVALRPAHCLAVYAPFVAQETRPNRSVPYGVVAKACMYGLYDVPLTVSAWLLREVLGLRLLSPFATIVDEDIVQGSMPFGSDAATLAAPPYNVGAVVNMCREWPGPRAAYGRNGIEQCWLPTQDTTVATVRDLREGARFIAAQRAARPGRRVYVHCKGGIGRATTMSLAHYMINRGEDPARAMARLKAARPIVRDVRDYHSIEQIADELARGGARRDGTS